jgi:hypothetical protein
MENPAHSSSAKHQFDMLGTQITEAMERLHVPGVAVGVLLEDDNYIAGFGITSLDNPLPVTGDTLFQIGSTTKTVTATIAMRLVEQGKLDLDSPVRRYLPELRLSDESVASRVTMKHLFTHTGGWVGDYFNDFGGATEHMGITWMLRHFGGLRVVEHGGATNGQLSAFLMVPERHFAITLLTNSETGGQLTGEITKWALEHYCGVNEPEPPHLTLSAEQLMTYTGRYAGAANDFQITVHEGTLILQDIPKGGFPTPDTPPPPADPPVRLAFVVDEDHILALDQPIKRAPSFCVTAMAG